MFNNLIQANPEDDLEKLMNLNYVQGPKVVKLNSRSTIFIPNEQIQFLDEKNTASFNKILHNIPIAGETSIITDKWQAYFNFYETGYIKDEDDINADEIFKSKKESERLANQERIKKGWETQTLVGWHTKPFYNSEEKRLEWAVIIKDSNNFETINFETRVLGRKGYTSALLASTDKDLDLAIQQFNRLLDTFKYVEGEKYSEFTQGDRIAEFGLAALITGGAAALATKKGFWAMIGGFFAAIWKLIIPIFILIIAKIGSILNWIKNIFKRKE